MKLTYIIHSYKDVNTRHKYLLNNHYVLTLNTCVTSGRANIYTNHATNTKTHSNPTTKNTHKRTTANQIIVIDHSVYVIDVSTK